MVLRWRDRQLANGADEPVTSLGYCFNVLGILSQRFPQDKDVIGNIASSTKESGQSVLLSSSFSSRWPLLRTKSTRVSKALGVRTTSSLLRDNLRSAGSRRKGPNS